MTDSLLDKFKKIPRGTKITIKIESFFGQDVKTKSTYMGEIKQDGYMGEGYGSWSCYQDKYTPVPCYKVLVRPYRKQNLYWMKLHMDIKSVKLGWE